MSNDVSVNRELITASIDISASPAQVWALVGDLSRMGEISPQCKKMFIRGGGPVEVGTRTINLNRQGWKWWPTRSKVVSYEPERKLALRIAENSTIWTYELEPIDGGTRLTESRTTPHGVTDLSNFLSRHVLGGTTEFEDELQRGIETTLARIKAIVEKA